MSAHCEQLKELVNAYNTYTAQTVERHIEDAKERMFKDAETFAVYKGWQSWNIELVLVTERHQCKCTCGDIHMRIGRRPGLYINGTSLQELVDECKE